MSGEADSSSSQPLEPAVQTMIDATNSGDADALLDAFTDDASVTDFGRTFAGTEEIGRWNVGENIGHQLTVTGATRSGSTVTVSVDVSSEGFNGPGSLIFELEGGLIRHLEITG